MNEEEALRCAVNILRTMSAIQGHNDNDIYLEAALDDLDEMIAELKADPEAWALYQQALERDQKEEE